MPRIVYYAFPTGRVQGGIKMTLRHVETLRELGFDAVFSTTAECQMPAWMDFTAPVLRNMPVKRDDILVIPEDATNAMAQAARRTSSKTVVLCQNQFILGGLALEAVDSLLEAVPATFLAVGRIQAALLRRAYPQAPVEVVPCFADERLFAPQGARSPDIAYVPKKRAFEPQVIRGFFRKFYPGHAERSWVAIAEMAEKDVAASFAGSELYLSLSRFESVGMATLEAMASGCVCAGFTGMSGQQQEYATPDNGFWAPEDDCVAAAEALGRAADVASSGGPVLARYVEAARETARDWSYARFKPVLEEVWMRLAPEARLRNGPLD